MTKPRPSSKKKKRRYHRRVNCYGFVNRITLRDLKRVKGFCGYGPQPGEVSGCFELFIMVARVMLVSRGALYTNAGISQGKIDHMAEMLSSIFIPFRAIADGYIPCRLIEAPPEGYSPVRVYTSLQDYHWVRPQGKFLVGKMGNGFAARTVRAESEEENIRRVLSRRHKFVRTIAFYAPPKKNFLTARRQPLIPACHDWLVEAVRKLQADFPGFAADWEKWAVERGLDLSKKTKAPWLGAYPMIPMDIIWRHFERYEGLRLNGALPLKPVAPEIAKQVLSLPSRCGFCGRRMPTVRVPGL